VWEKEFLSKFGGESAFGGSIGERGCCLFLGTKPARQGVGSGEGTISLTGEEVGLCPLGKKNFLLFQKKKILKKNEKKT